MLTLEAPPVYVTGNTASGCKTKISQKYEGLCSYDREHFLVRQQKVFFVFPSSRVLFTVIS